MAKKTTCPITRAQFDADAKPLKVVINCTEMDVETKKFSTGSIGWFTNNKVTVEVGGVRTLFRMPDLLSLALGGGTEISADGRRIGPRSVGYRLTSRALCFGGDTLTATDIAVAAGRIALGERDRVAHLSPSFAESGMRQMGEMISDGIDRMKTDAAEVPLLAVGGGSFLVPEKVPGASAVVRVEHHAVANAVGAAIAQVSGEVDRIFTGIGRVQAIERAQAEATQRALDAGADPGSVAVLDIDDIPLSYLPGDARRVRVRVIADIADFGDRQDETNFG